MRNEQYWKEHSKIRDYIRDNYKSLRDIDLTIAIKERFELDIDPEGIRNLRRSRGWKKGVSPSGESVEKFEKAVFITCLHIPFHDKELFALFLVFLKYFQPDILFILGDYLDWYQVSYFDKDPKRIGYLQDDIDTGERLLDMMLKLVDKIVFLDGNHEWRMVRYLRKNPELYGLKCLQVSSLLGLSERKIKHHNYLSPPIKYHGLQIHHGTLVRKYSGWTAKGHYEKYGGCGIVGHSHRGGNFLKRNTEGVFGWWENFCMCQLKPEYLDFADWIQGWSLAYFYKKDLFHLEQVPVIKHKFLFQGKLFST